MRKILFFFVLVSLTSAADAQPYYVAGEFQSPSPWSLDASVSMHDDGLNGDAIASDGIYSLKYTVLTAKRNEYQVSTAGWGTKWPADDTQHSWVTTTSNSQEVLFTFDTNTRTDDFWPKTNIINANDSKPAIIVAVGDWQGWTNNSAETVMHDDGLNSDLASGDGIYTYKATISTSGDHQFKPVISGTWDGWGTNCRHISGPIGAINLGFTTTVSSQIVYLYLNYNTGRIAYSLNDPLSAGSLPVEMTSFTVLASTGLVTLNWTTATEVNNNGFDVEKKSSAHNWQKIGFVEGHGTTNAAQQYMFVDRDASSGVTSYRLKQIDRDGKYEYSSIVEASVDMTAQDYRLSQNYPNPFNPSTTFSFALKNAEHASVTVFNALGQEVAVLFNGVAQPNQLYAVTFDAKNLPSGIYFYSLRSNSRNEMKKMTLVK